MQIGASFRDSVVAVGYPDIRWHQTADYGYVPNPRMKNVFMAVTMDITDFNSPYGGWVQQNCYYVIRLFEICFLSFFPNLYLHS